MAIIDATIVNVALDTIAGNLGATIDEVSWVATGYILSAVIIMPLNGYLTATLGRKYFYASSLVVFTIASLLCGTARSIWVLVFYRVLQGIGGGALQPTAQAILFESYPPEQRNMAMAIFGLGAMVGPAIGPTLGGYIVNNASWPLIFFINVPIGILAVIMTVLFVPDPPYIGRRTGDADWLALVLLASGLGALQYVLERGQHDDWFSSNTIVILSATSLVGLVWFIVRTLRSANPLVHLSVFKFRQFTAGSVLSLVTGFGLFGMNLVLPLFFQNILGFDAWQTGLALLPGAAATAVSMLIVPRLAKAIDSRIVLAAGIFMFGVAGWWLGGLDSDAGYWNIFWPRAIQGLALGFLFVPMSTLQLSGLPREELSNATGLVSLVRQIGGSFGIAILTTLLSRRMVQYGSALASGVTNAQVSRATQILSNGAAVNHHSMAQAIAQLYGIVQQQASVLSYEFLFRMSALVFFCAIPLVLLFRVVKTPETTDATVVVE